MPRKLVTERGQQAVGTLAVLGGRGGGCHHERCQGCTGSDDGRLTHPGTPQQRGFHLARFDSVTVDLQLSVGATCEGDPAIAKPCPQVAGAVHALTAGGGDESRCGVAGLAQIAPRQLVSGDVELADHADGELPQTRVEDEDVRAGNGGTQRDAVGSLGTGEHVAGHLGGPVGVDDLGLGAGRAQRTQVGGFQWFTADDPAPQPGDVGRVFVGQRRGKSRHREQLPNVVGMDEFGQHPAVSCGVVRGEHGVRARCESGEQFGGAVDERQRTLGQPDGCRPLLERPDESVGQGAMGSHDGLRSSGGARREQHRDCVERTDRDGFERSWLRIGRTDVECDGVGGWDPGYGRVSGGVDEHCARAHVTEHELDACPRVRQVDGEVCRAAADDRPHGGNQVLVAGQCQCHDVAVANSGARQLVCNACCP